MALVDDEGGFGEGGFRDLVGAEEPDYFWGGVGDGGGRGNKADIVGAGTRGGALEDIVALPVWFEEVGGVFVDKGTDGFEYGFRVRVLDTGGADYYHRPFGGLELFPEGAGEGFFEVGGGGTEVVEVESAGEGFADEANFKVGTEPLFANTGVEDSGFVARVGADEEDGVGFFNAIDFAVEEIGGAEVDAMCRGLVAIGLVEAEVVGVEFIG